MWQLNSWNCDQTKIVTKLKNASCTKLKTLNCDKTKQKILKLWQSSTTQIVTKLKTQIATKLNSNCDKMHKLKLWQNSKFILWQNSKLKNLYSNKTQNSNCDKEIKKKIWRQNLKSFYVIKTWNLNNRWCILWAAFEFLGPFFLTHYFVWENLITELILTMFCHNLVNNIALFCKVFL